MNSILKIIFVLISIQLNLGIGFKLIPAQYKSQLNDANPSFPEIKKTANDAKKSSNTARQTYAAVSSNDLNQPESSMYEYVSPLVREPFIDPPYYNLPPPIDDLFYDIEEFPYESFPNFFYQPYSTIPLFDLPQIPIQFETLPLPSVGQSNSMTTDGKTLESGASTTTTTTTVPPTSSTEENQSDAVRGELLKKLLELILDTVRANGTAAIATGYQVHENDETDEYKISPTYKPDQVAEGNENYKGLAPDPTTVAAAAVAADDDENHRHENKIEQPIVTDTASFLRNFTDRNGNLCVEELIKSFPKSYIKITCEDRSYDLGTRPTTTHRSNVTFYTKELTTEKASKSNAEQKQIDSRTSPLPADNDYSE